MNMALTQLIRQTIVARAQRDPAFAKALPDEAATLILNGEPHTARLILRDLVNATVGYDELAVETAKPAKSLHRVLSKGGNSTMDNPAAVLGVVRKKLGGENSGSHRRSTVNRVSAAQSLATRPRSSAPPCAYRR